MVTKTVCCWHKKQIHKLEDPEINPFIYALLIFKKKCSCLEEKNGVVSK
jgi:hypothetical protein